ncbi:ubiquinol-cytochrome c reductase iron-sulfur subunit [soil metagenome]
MNEQSEPQLSRRHFLAWLWRLPVLGTALALGVGAWQASRVHFLKLEPAAEPDFRHLEAQRVAALTDFAEAWASRDFDLAGMPAVAIRLPEPVSGGLTVGEQHYAAYSRVCTHLGCTVVYRRDTEAVALGFNYRSSQPSLACPCHLGVFAPAQAGRAVSGPPVDPLFRVELRAEEGALYAVGLERRDG